MKNVALAFQKRSMPWAEQVPWRSLVRWWIVGLAFTGGGLVVLYILRDILRLPLIVATAAGAEATLLVRFLINDRWVFGHRRPTWLRLWQFHLASAGGGVIWWVVANLLPRFGVQYLLAALAGSACSVVFSMATNFLWIWRQRVRAVTADSVETLDAD
jgi:putative flippase GtrA